MKNQIVMGLFGGAMLLQGGIASTLYRRYGWRWPFFVAATVLFLLCSTSCAPFHGYYKAPAYGERGYVPVGHNSGKNKSCTPPNWEPGCDEYLKAVAK